MVGRFGPRSRVKNGDVVDVAVDTRPLHFFDLETGLGIYRRRRAVTTRAHRPDDGEGAQA